MSGASRCAGARARDGSGRRAGGPGPLRQAHCCTERGPGPPPGSGRGAGRRTRRVPRVRGHLGCTWRSGRGHGSGRRRRRGQPGDDDRGRDRPAQLRRGPGHRQLRGQRRDRLAVLLVIGFGLHNATEGFGIVAPLAGGRDRPSWGFLGPARTHRRRPDLRRHPGRTQRGQRHRRDRLPRRWRPGRCSTSSSSCSPWRAGPGSRS